MIQLYFILRVLVYAQSLIWIYLLDKNIRINSIFIKSLFIPLLAITYGLIDMTQFSFNQYPYYLLRYYIGLILYSYVVLRFKYNFYDTVCLSFLLVFINSYYWEFISHFNAIIFYGLSFNQFIQAFHLIPAYLLYKKIWIENRKGFFKLIGLGLIISNINLLAYNFINRFWFYGLPVNQQLFNNITRFICLNILLYAIINYADIIKKEGNIKLPFPNSKCH